MTTDPSKEAVAWGAACSVDDQQLGDADAHFACYLHPDICLLQTQGVQAVAVKFSSKCRDGRESREGKGSLIAL